MPKIDIKKFRLCPKCKSSDVELKPTVLESGFGLLPFTIKCNKCNFKSRIEVELNKKKKKTGNIRYLSRGGVSINKKC